LQYENRCGATITAAKIAIAVPNNARPTLAARKVPGPTQHKAQE